MNQAVTKEDHERVVQYYQEGHSLKECMRLMRWGQAKVLRCLRKENVKPHPKHRRPVAADKKAEIVRLYALGYSTVRCGRMTKSGSKTVFDALHEAGVTLRKETWREDKIQKLVDLYQSGISITQCCLLMETNSAVVRKYLALKNVKLRPPALLYGENNNAWKGGRKGGNGRYVYLLNPDHPATNSHGYVLEHRLVMEEHLGRYLKPAEVVHHKNKVKDDNRIENLELFATNGEHLAVELKGQCPKWTEDGKRRIKASRQRYSAKMRKKVRSKTDDQQTRLSAPRKKK